MADLQLYLASASPRRKALLEQLNLRFEVLRVDVEEQRQAQEEAVDYVRRLSFDKAMAGVHVSPLNLPVLGSDTIVVCDGQVMEKPENIEHSHQMLSLLSGRKHQVMTAVTLADRNQSLTTLVTTDVWFKSLSLEEIDAYWESGEPCDKAGATLFKVSEAVSLLALKVATMQWLVCLFMKQTLCLTNLKN